MVIRKSKPEKGIFLIMPFEETPTRNKEQLNSFYKDNIKDPIEKASFDYKYKVWRSGESFNITDEIIKDLFRADIVIADLSGIKPNPNVMYELGVRLALSDKPVILIREQNPENKKIFDIDKYYIHSYDPFKYSELKDHLINKLHRFEIGEEQFESPVKKILSAELIFSQSALSSLTISEQKDIVLRGAKLVEQIISTSIGPFGSGLSIKDKSGAHVLAKRGLNICEALWSANPLESRGIELLAEVGRSMIHNVGDGSKAAILMAYEMMEIGNQALKNGSIPKNIILGMEKAVTEAKKYIDKNTFLLKNQIDVANIASTAAKNETAGEVIAESFNAVGKEGIILFSESNSSDTNVEVTEGAQLNRGYISLDFVTNPEAAACEFDDCYILLYPKVISHHTEIIPVMEKVAATSSPLLIIAEDVEDAALDTLVLNAKKKSLNSVAVKAPGHGDRRIDMFEDLAIYTGGNVVSSNNNISFSNIEISDLGRAKKVIVTDKTCRIIDGACTHSELEAQVKRLRTAQDSASSAYEREITQERLAMLVGAKAIIYVGGVSKQDVVEKNYGFSSAINSTRSAIEYGAVPGEGITLFRAKEKLSSVTIENQEESDGFEAVMKGLEAPLNHLIKNSNLNRNEILQIIDKTQDNRIGFNIENGTKEDLIKAGIIDPTYVLKSALEFALSYSKMFLETSSWVDIDKKSVT